MNPGPSRLDRFTGWMFRHRNVLVALFTALTAGMLWLALGVRVDASFDKSLPRGHPYIQTFVKHQAAFKRLAFLWIG